MATSNGGAHVDLGIVVPARNEEQNLPILIRELAHAFRDSGVLYEVLLVDDGSDDGTADVMRALATENHNVRGLILSRNFGHQAAISIGLQHCNGRTVAIMDADLQDRPSDLLLLYGQLQAEHADVVYAVRSKRKENFVKRGAYWAFYRILGQLANVTIPLDLGDFCVMDRTFVARLNALPERLRFVRGLRAWLGGRQVGLIVDRDPRRAGKAQYTFNKLMGLAADGLISFSFVPLRIAALAGTFVSALAFIGVFVVLTWHFTGKLPQGVGLATIALSVLFLGGIQLLSIGILGEYVGRIFDEVKARPVGIVTEVVPNATASEPAIVRSITPAQL